MSKNIRKTGSDRMTLTTASWDSQLSNCRTEVSSSTLYGERERWMEGEGERDWGVRYDDIVSIEQDEGEVK